MYESNDTTVSDAVLVNDMLDVVLDFLSVSGDSSDQHIAAG